MENQIVQNCATANQGQIVRIQYVRSIQETRNQTILTSIKMKKKVAYLQLSKKIYQVQVNLAIKLGKDNEIILLNHRMENVIVEDLDPKVLIFAITNMTKYQDLKVLVLNGIKIRDQIVHTLVTIKLKRNPLLPITITTQGIKVHVLDINVAVQNHQI